jgi:hypothetical protein
MNSVKKHSRYRNPIKTPNLHLIKKKGRKIPAFDFDFRGLILLPVGSKNG